MSPVEIRSRVEGQVRVLLEGREVELPCPSVLGAILIKARAVDVVDDPDKHHRDSALLLLLLPWMTPGVL
jgi:hypothetical protein